MPESDLQGSNFRNGVKFSVQTFSDANDACRNWCGSVQFGSKPSGSKVKTGEVVRKLSSEPRDAQNNPANAFRRPRHRWSTLS